MSLQASLESVKVPFSDTYITEYSSLAWQCPNIRLSGLQHIYLQTNVTEDCILAFSSHHDVCLQLVPRDGIVQGTLSSHWHTGYIHNIAVVDSSLDILLGLS